MLFANKKKKVPFWLLTTVKKNGTIGFCNKSGLNDEEPVAGD